MSDEKISNTLPLNSSWSRIDPDLGLTLDHVEAASSSYPGGLPSTKLGSPSSLGGGNGSVDNREYASFDHVASAQQRITQFDPPSSLVHGFNDTREYFLKDTPFDHITSAKELIAQFDRSWHGGGNESAQGSSDRRRTSPWDQSSKERESQDRPPEQSRTACVKHPELGYVPRRRHPPTRARVRAGQGVSLGKAAPHSVLLSTKEGEAFNHVKDWMLLWLKKSFRSHGSQQESSPVTRHWASSEASNSRPEASRRQQKRERAPNDADGDDSDSDDEDKPPKKKANFPDRSRRFGCPFFKHNPRNHRQYQACTGRGFPNVHRVKEHLYKRHTPSEYRCLRCYKPFEHEPALADHARNVPCNKEEPPMKEVEGVSKEQLTKLKRRSKNGVPEHERWIEVYLILFPDKAGSAMPSPYVGLYGEEKSKEEPCGSKRWPPLEDPQRLESFFLRECPRHLEKQLQSRDVRPTELLEESGRAELVQMIPKILIGLISDLNEWPEGLTDVATTCQETAVEGGGGESNAAQNLETSPGRTQQGSSSPMQGHSESEGFPSHHNLKAPGDLGFVVSLPPSPSNFLESLDWLHQMGETNQDMDQINFEDILDPPRPTSLEDYIPDASQFEIEGTFNFPSQLNVEEEFKSLHRGESSGGENQAGMLPSLTRSGSEPTSSSVSDMGADPKPGFAGDAIQGLSFARKNADNGTWQFEFQGDADGVTKEKGRVSTRESIFGADYDVDGDCSLSIVSLD